MSLDHHLTLYLLWLTLNSTEPKLDHNPGGNHSRRQSVSHRKKGRHPSRWRSSSPGEHFGKPARRAKRKAWTEDEKRCYEILLRMDDTTKHDRVGCVVRQSPSPLIFELLVNEHRCKPVDFRQDAAKSTNRNLKPGDM